MQYVRLGKTGLRVSRICLGTMTYGSRQWRDWVLEEDEALPFYKRALEAGINFFDTADVYSVGVSEEITGKALKEYAGRADVVIATKVHGPMGGGPNERGLSRKHIFDSIDNSLRRLQTDYVDLYQIHRWDTADADRGDAGSAERPRAHPGRCATSAPPACTPGSSPRRWTSRSAAAGPGSTRCRTTTTSSTAKRSVR